MLDSSAGIRGVQQMDRYCPARTVGGRVVGKFAIQRGRGGKTHFELLASNGRVVATSETYESKESCLKCIAAVMRLAADAVVIEEPPKAAKTPPATKAAPTK